MSSNFNLKKYFVIALSIFVLFGMNDFGFAQPTKHEDPKGPGRVSARVVKRAPTPQQKKFVDSRYRHNRSYPARGQSFRALPRDNRAVIHGHSRYYSSHGVWYRHDRGRYFVVAPPVGLFVPFLPLAYATIWMHGIPYYYANETYYTQTPGGYMVVEPPQGEVSETPPDTEADESEDIADEKMFIYPRNGQSEEQQAKDRYECHKLASEQTNYDPTKFPSEIPADQIMNARADYQRAMAACLDSRGYTAK
jgi:hypothetical protein